MIEKCQIGTSRDANMAALDTPFWHANNIQGLLIRELRNSYIFIFFLKIKESIKIKSNVEFDMDQAMIVGA